MNFSLLSKVILATWNELGLTIDNLCDDHDVLTVWVSVPESGYRTDAHNEMMCGMYMARRFRETLIDMGANAPIVKAKIRSGDCWTQEKARAAKEKAFQTLF